MKLEVFLTNCLSSLTPRNTLLFEKLIAPQLARKRPRISWMPKTKYRVHNNLPLVSTPDKSWFTRSCISCLKPILVSSNYLGLKVPSGLFPSDLWPKFLYVVSSAPKPTPITRNSSSPASCLLHPYALRSAVSSNTPFMRALWLLSQSLSGVTSHIIWIHADK